MNWISLGTCKHRNIECESDDHCPEGKKYMKWISVEEEMPPIDQQVLFIVRGYSILNDVGYYHCTNVGRYEGHYFRVSWREDRFPVELNKQTTGYYVSHWMPFPQQPKEKQ